jgi:hypothetical protein
VVLAKLVDVHPTIVFEVFALLLLIIAQTGVDAINKDILKVLNGE